MRFAVINSSQHQVLEIFLWRKIYMARLQQIFLNHLSKNFKIDLNMF